MAKAKNYFEGTPAQFRFHYGFLLLEYKDEAIVAWPFVGSARPMNKTTKREFVDFLFSSMPEDQFRIKINGERILHLWTVTDDWEIAAKLSDMAAYKAIEVRNTR